jgi:hypothetical protein
MQFGENSAMMLSELLATDNTFEATAKMQNIELPDESNVNSDGKLFYATYFYCICMIACDLFVAASSDSCLSGAVNPSTETFSKMDHSSHWDTAEGVRKLTNPVAQAFWSN